MNAQTVIDHIMKLPREEQARLVEVLEELKSALQGREDSPQDFGQSAESDLERKIELMQTLGR